MPIFELEGYDKKTFNSKCSAMEEQN